MSESAIAERRSLHEEQKVFAGTLGVLRAETLGNRVFELFTEPAFFPELESGNSCFLLGGRGTGKTTLLRCLSYQGQAALRTGKERPIERWSYIGMFSRIDIGKVRSFHGPEIEQDRWTKIFSHYVNLELTENLLDVVAWLEAETQQRLSEDVYPELLATLHAELPLHRLDLAATRAALGKLRRRFEAGINNIADVAADIRLSMLGAPMEFLIGALRSWNVLRGKRLFFLIDEYENLLDNQQEVYNTLVKNVWPDCAFKVGVKLMGWRKRTTIGGGEVLSSPADYARIDITERLSTQFPEFARRIIEARLKHSPMPMPEERTVPDMFESLSLEDEARRLGIGEMRLRPPKGTSLSLHEKFRELAPLKRAFAVVWSRGDVDEWEEAVKGLTTEDKRWERRFQNYSYAVLFVIRAKKPGRRKFYAGWRTICMLAGANVRYLLDLVSAMLNRHFQEGGQLGEVLSAELQTDVAQEVGRKNIGELERDSDDARKLQRLVLSLGRVFEVLAARPVGHAPEITQFALPPEDDALGPPSARTVEVGRILAEGVNAQALLRLHASKRQGPADARAYDYMLHPVFAPLFVISHRRKRKIEIREDELMGMITEPKWAISRVLLRLRRDPTEAPLPDQLKLFRAYYE